MSGVGGFLVLGFLSWLVWAVLFGDPKSKWQPFHGLVKHNKRTGTYTAELTLPWARKRKGRRR